MWNSLLVPLPAETQTPVVPQPEGARTVRAEAGRLPEAGSLQAQGVIRITGWRRWLHDWHWPGR